MKNMTMTAAVLAALGLTVHALPAAAQGRGQARGQVNDERGRDGHDRDGYDRDGYDRDGYGRDGYGRDGYGRDGYGRDGYGRDGYRRDGYDRSGYDRNGRDRHGRARGGGDRLDRQDLQALRRTAVRLETATDSFRRTLDRALDRSPLNGSQREDDINAEAKRLEWNADRFKDAVHDGGDARRLAGELFESARVLDRVMDRRRLDSAAERDWLRVERELNQIADRLRVRHWNDGGRDDHGREGRGRDDHARGRDDHDRGRDDHHDHGR